MDWNKIKTIFIITFLILDIYLIYQYFESRNANQYEIMTQTSFEEKLQADDIKYVDLPKEKIKAKYISATPKVFKNEELINLDEGEITIHDGTTLHVTLKEPIKINKFDSAELTTFVKGKIINGDQYKFWKKSETEKTITYYQFYKDRLFYKNKNGRLTFFLNDENEIISYEQTLLVDIEEISGNEEIVPPLQAIETLYEQQKLKPKSKITKVELGYYTFVQLTGSQVLTPTWRFVINHDEDVFVNAFEGQIFQVNSDTTVLE
ncbi:two-component system regulatory protein YycI [Bacillus aquiflavi]|uniref:Two-component system regulatory protein YycI n=1 Tax=Bacillus aquiflavi TaxID=2672567 RepID=A0A6B3W5A3_9BACI|nr:two-component system regulatory protein YycI [Bacillus aquiflavi]MBA4538295.1 two-component system regulatory protein YycI [Bacillus aquiflavi]NEY82614.1 hypothetical protein [Bacillus aquiflavi]